MRIALLVTAHRGGGAEYTARQWIRELSELGHAVFVYSFKPGGAARDYGPGVVCRHLPVANRTVRLMMLPVWAARYMRSDRIDVLMALSTTPNLIGLLGAYMLGTRRPAVAISERNMPSIYLATLGTAGWLQAALAKRLYRKADGVVAISHPVAADVLSGYGVAQERIYVVPNPSLSGSASPWLPPDAITVLFAGRMVPQKRPGLFLEVIRELKRRGRHVQGFMYGDGPLAADIRTEVRRDGLPTSVCDWRDDWMTLHADDEGVCLLLTSSSEGLGNVFIDAFEHRLPAVAWSGALGVADAIVPEVTGVLALTDLPQDLAGAVERASTIRFDIADWALRWGDASSARILERALMLTIGRRRSS